MRAESPCPRWWPRSRTQSCRSGIEAGKAHGELQTKEIKYFKLIEFRYFFSKKKLTVATRGTAAAPAANVSGNSRDNTNSNSSSITTTTTTATEAASSSKGRSTNFTSKRFSSNKRRNLSPHKFKIRFSTHSILSSGPALTRPW